MNTLLSTSRPLTFSYKQCINPTPLLLSLNVNNQSFLPSRKPRNPRRPRTPISAKSNGSSSADPPDRLISAICYFYPFFDGIQYGKYVITQFTPIQALLQPLFPVIKVFKSFPFNGFLVFLTLYFFVVRNPNFSRYVRFNTMQAIVLDVLLIFPDLLERTFNPRDGLGLDLMMSLDSTVFLYLLVCLIYGSASCLLGQLPRLPIVADAADRLPQASMSSNNNNDRRNSSSKQLPVSNVSVPCLSTMLGLATRANRRAGLLVGVHQNHHRQARSESSPPSPSSVAMKRAEPLFASVLDATWRLGFED